jgi:nucleotidyltransferase/DNA polymerase involved in DNA repair
MSVDVGPEFSWKVSTELKWETRESMSSISIIRKLRNISGHMKQKTIPDSSSTEEMSLKLSAEVMERISNLLCSCVWDRAEKFCSEVEGNHPTLLESPFQVSAKRYRQNCSICTRCRWHCQVKLIAHTTTARSLCLSCVWYYKIL